MEASSLIPSPDIVPAPPWLFHVLDVSFFLIHIILINIILGGCLIILANRLRSNSATTEQCLHDAATSKIPIIFALGINMGVAPLLFLQVIYGHLFYSSSILMAKYWIAIIPLLILAYYGSYVHNKTYITRPTISKTAIAITSLVLLYIGFMFVNNILLMIQPGKWSAYFANRGGTILSLADETLIPRYLHFVTASIAIAGLFMSVVWHRRRKKEASLANQKIIQGLKIFGYATVVQIVIGLWFLTSIPRQFMLEYMGGNLLFTIIFLIGFLSGIGAVSTAFAGKLRPTVTQLLITIIAMVLMRDHLRTLYLQNQFDLSQLRVAPQYSVMILFFTILIIGLIAVGYMLKTAFYNRERRAAP